MNKKLDFKKITKLEHLLRNDGKLNPRIIERDEFKFIPLYRFIIENTTELNIFEDITFAARFWFLYDDMKIHYCNKCGAARIYFKHLQRMFKKCNHKENFNAIVLNKTRLKIKNSLIDIIVNALSTNTVFLTASTYSEFIKKYYNKDANYGFLLSKKSVYFYSDLILNTINLIPFDQSDLHISERLYLEYNHLKEKPLCKYCNKKPVGFINRLAGYADSCRDPLCRVKKTNEKHIERNFKNCKTFVDKIIDEKQFTVIKYPQLLTKEPLIIQCNKCHKNTEIMLINGLINKITSSDLYCQYCTPHGQSKPEREISLFLASLNITPTTNTRKIISPLELDIYINNKKLAIEFDGLYWHSSMNISDKTRHIEKTMMCEKQGIQLIHIFENEWLTKQDIVKSRIKNLLGIYNKTIFARKCIVKEVSSQESQDFQDQNHLQGAIKSKVNLGLYFQDKLVSLMTFSKPRFDRKHEWELVRFCNKLGHHIPGAAGKLLKHFEKNYKPKNLVSYADRRWSQGKLYKALGFTLDHISPPNYWYWKNILLLESRIKYQKHKLKNILEKFDETLSEAENMRNNGYHRIYDCGNLVFVKMY